MVFQKCHIYMKIPKFQQTSVRVSPNTVEMEGETNLAKYIVSKWSIAYHNYSKFKIFYLFYSPLFLN